MSDVVSQIEHSVETLASPAFAWAYMTDVANWHDPPARFRLDGPFASGSRGATDVPGQLTRQWQLRDVRPMERYTVEFPLDRPRASAEIQWQFSRAQDGRTRLTQCITLRGEDSSYVAEVQQVFASGLAPGMTRIAEAMNQAYEASRQKGRD